jgi:hypothetical protein
MYEMYDIYFVRVVPLEWMYTNVQIQRLNDMDEHFKTFLSKKGITEAKYNGMSDELQFKWGELFEKREQGKTNIIHSTFIVFTLILSFPCLLSSCIYRIVVKLVSCSSFVFFILAAAGSRLPIVCMKDRIFDHAPRGGVDLSTVLVSNLAYKIAVTQVKFVESHSDTFELGDCEYGVAVDALLQHILVGNVGSSE